MAQKTEKEESELKVLGVSSSCSTGQKKKVEKVKEGRCRKERRVEVVRRSEEGGWEGEGEKVVNRCNGCNRKVGLTGFRCRCGELFCWEHRYSDRHDCSFDYKTAAREAIARDNPVVKAAKILRV